MACKMGVRTMDTILQSKPPVVVCESAYTKNGKTAEQPIPDSLAVALRTCVAGRPPGCPVFDLVPEFKFRRF
jgi:hypothetical protein